MQFLNKKFKNSSYGGQNADLQKREREKFVILVRISLPAMKTPLQLLCQRLYCLSPAEPGTEIIALT